MLVERWLMLLIVLAVAVCAGNLSGRTGDSAAEDTTQGIREPSVATIDLRAGQRSSLARQLELATGAISAPATRLLREDKDAAQLTDAADEIYWDGFDLCGNGIIDATEQCDRADLGGQTCGTLGYPGGSLSCTHQCNFYTSQCAASCALSCNNDSDCGGPACGPCFQHVCLGGLSAERSGSQ